MGQRLIAAANFFNEPEVSEAYFAVGAEENVGWFYVAVNDPVAVRPSQPTRDSSPDPRDLHGAQLAGRGESLLEVFPLHQLHRHVGVAPFVAEVEDLHDVCVGQLRKLLRLEKKPVPKLLLGSQVPWQDLDRHGALETHLVASIDRAHAAAPEFGVDTEATKGHANERVWFSGHGPPTLPLV